MYTSILWLTNLEHISQRCGVATCRLKWQVLAEGPLCHFRKRRLNPLTIEV
jgi:hypothetical protein